jgi:hypothetical protein
LDPDVVIIVEPQQQVEFLSNIQRLLSEGQFTATYKYALLLAIADICVEEGDDDGAPFVIQTSKIAEKFIAYYWPQIRPYEGVVLRQNTGKAPAIISALSQVADGGVAALNELKRDTAAWRRLVRKVDGVVREMPLWKLQILGNAPLEFLYENRGQGTSIELNPGVMFCLRRFHELVTDLVRGAWLRYVRRFNGQVLGTPNDLDQFLFGAERAPLVKYLPILREVQEARCLYCEREISPNAAHVDHFIPWSRYPVDLGHNFVLSHATCNGAKADHLAAREHLGRWVERNRTATAFLRERFDKALIAHSARSSEAIGRWAYSQAAATHALGWVRSLEFQPIDESYLRLLS